MAVVVIVIVIVIISSSSIISISINQVSKDFTLAVASLEMYSIILG